MAPLQPRSQFARQATCRNSTCAALRDTPIRRSSSACSFSPGVGSSGTSGRLARHVVQMISRGRPISDTDTPTRRRVGASSTTRDAAYPMQALGSSRQSSCRGIPHGTRFVAGWQVSWLADQTLLVGLPGITQWPHDEPLSAYSCGSSSGFGVDPAPHSLFTFRMEGPSENL